MIAALHSSSFKQYLFEKFEVHFPLGEKLELELVEVEDTSTEKMESFSLIFRGPSEKLFRNDDHIISHPKMGAFRMFIGPVIYPKTDCVYYQAVFNRFKQANNVG